MVAAILKNSSALRVLVTGGGTGGHLFPGIALAEGIGRRCEQSEVLFVGTDRQLDMQALARRRFATAAIRCQGLKGATVLAKLRGLSSLPLALWQALKVVRRFRPTLVFGVGGYVTGPVVVAARLLRVATCIHEQNSIPGLTNRLLGRIVDRIFISLPGSERYFPKGKCVLSGNPVREELLAAAAAPAPAAEGSTLLVLGGSQGAHQVNELVVEALAGAVDRLPPGFTVIHQTGVQDREDVQARYTELGLKAEVSAFIDDMAGVYRRADLVVSRAGATTLAELMVFGKPAVVIPYPHAADDHQAWNGQFLVDHGAGLMYREEELSGAKLAEELIGLLGDAGRRQGMASQAASLARPRATETIIEECLKLLKLKRPEERSTHHV